jgi:deoxyribodipyrimidine photolyase
LDKKKGLKEKNEQNLIDASREVDNISTLRDILFGNKITEYEKRFKDLEDHMNLEMGNIREEVNRLYKSLEQFVKDEQKNLSERLREEQEERDTADHRIREDIDSMSKKSTAHKKENADGHRDLRQLLLEQHKKLSDELQQLKRELTTTIDNKSSILDDKKVNRLALADLLTELALQLSKESESSSEQG